MSVALTRQKKYPSSWKLDAASKCPALFINVERAKSPSFLLDDDFNICSVKLTNCIAPTPVSISHV